MRASSAARSNVYAGASGFAFIYLTQATRIKMPMTLTPNICQALGGGGSGEEEGGG
jgi:hypothetical protein